MKIDMFAHVFPRRTFDRFLELAPNQGEMGKRVRNIPMMFDLDLRFRIMDRFGDYHQVLSLASPPVEGLVGPEHAVEFARMANDEMAELVLKHPDRFTGFAASLPLTDAARAERELEHAMRDLKALGLQIYTNVSGKPLDRPEFQFVFEAMAGYDMPIWLHPARGSTFPDYASEDHSLYEIWWTFGWPYETSVAMARLVFSGLFDRLPNIKILTHHMGAMIPYFEGRVGHGWDQLGRRTTGEEYTKLRQSMKMRPLEYFKLFYGDTAVFGSSSATRCGLDFFGVDHVLFASDTPFEPEPGMYIRETVDVLDRLNITAGEREQIYSKNAMRLMKLPAAR